MNANFFRSGTFAVAVAALPVLFAYPANAEFKSGDLYAAFSGHAVGPEFYTTTANSTRNTNRGHRIGIAVGYDFNPVRIEAEATQIQTPPKTTSHPLVNGGAETPMFGTITHRVLMLNGYYDFDLDGPFTPYLGVGAGLAKQSINLSASGFPSASGSDRIIAWQVIIGTAYEITKKVELTADFRYFDTSNPSFTSSSGSTYTVKGDAMQQFGIGLRYHF